MLGLSPFPPDAIGDDKSIVARVARKSINSNMETYNRSYALSDQRLRARSSVPRDLGAAAEPQAKICCCCCFLIRTNFYLVRLQKLQFTRDSKNTQFSVNLGKLATDDQGHRRLKPPVRMQVEAPSVIRQGPTNEVRDNRGYQRNKKHHNDVETASSSCIASCSS